MWRDFLATLRALMETYRQHWPRLLALDLVAKIAGFVVLVPLVGLVARALLAVSGSSLLADEDIVSFLLGPVGWAILLAVASANVAILAVELGAVLAYLVAAKEPGATSLRTAVLFALRRWLPILDLAWRLLLRFLLVLLPFAGAAALVAQGLLGQHDINYYLDKRPPEFFLALAAGACLAIGFATVAALLAARWFFALPLVLLEEQSPERAIAESVRRSKGHRLVVFLFLMAVILALALVSSITSGIVASATAWILGSVQRVPKLYVLVLGMAALCWFVVHLLLALVAGTVFAAAVATAYQRYALGTIPPGVSAELQPSKNGGTARFPVVASWIVLALALPAAGAVGWYLLASVPVEESVVVVAHRAGAFTGPENTLAAVERAIELGADYVEIDVQQTADGHVVVVHDRDLMKLAGVPLVIEQSTLKELKQVDIGSSFAPQYADQRIAELSELLSACRGRIGVVIELKKYGRANGLEEAVVRCVESLAMANEVVLMSLDRPTTRKLRELRPRWKVGQITAVAVGDLTKDDVDILSVSSSLATVALINRAQRRGQEVFVWTVNDPVLLSVMVSRGVDGVITDDVPMARNVLQQRSEMTPLERLMLEVAIFLGRKPTGAAGQASPE